MSWQLSIVVLVAIAGFLAGCKQDMDRQPKLTPYSIAGAFPDASAARLLPTGVVARGDLARDRAILTPPPASSALLERGRERFDIFCSPCHGRAGYGDGIIVARGFPKPPSYFEPRLMAVEAQYLFDVITHGHGAMYPYGSRIAPADRWAIVAYIRALQLSQSRDLAKGGTP